MLRLRAGIIALLALIAATLVYAEPQLPALTGRVVDGAGVLRDKAGLENRLATYEGSSGHQLVVATVPDLQGYDIRDFGNRLFRAWALGDKKRNDGVLVLVAPNDRKVSIEVGYGLEGDLTDALSRIIIENAIVPRFRSGDFDGGVSAGVDDVIKAIGGGGEQIRQRAENQSAPALVDYLPLIIFLLIIFFMFRNASRGNRVIFVPMGGGYGGGWSGGGGGGGFSGGGGSSGGGGASGSW